MSAPLTYEFRLECDELTLDVLHDDSQTCFASVPWPEEVRRADHELDSDELDELTGTMLFAVRAALEADGLAAADDDQLFNALHTVLTPGPPFTPADVSFSVGAVDRPLVQQVGLARAQDLTRAGFTATHNWRGTWGDPLQKVQLVERVGADQALVLFESHPEEGASRVAFKSLLDLDECSCRVYDDGDGESGPHLAVEMDDDCPLHGTDANEADPSLVIEDDSDLLFEPVLGETCRCGMWPFEEYGPVCPSCGLESEPFDGMTLHRENTRWGVKLTVVRDEDEVELFKVEVWKPHMQYGEMQTEGEVNWQAIGNTSPQVTRRVAEALELAAQIACELEPEDD